MGDLFWVAPFEYVRMKAAPLIVTAAIFAVLVALTVTLVARSLKGCDDGGSD